MTLMNARPRRPLTMQVLHRCVVVMALAFGGLCVEVLVAWLATFASGELHLEAFTDSTSAHQMWTRYALPDWPDPMFVRHDPGAAIDIVVIGAVVNDAPDEALASSPSLIPVSSERNFQLTVVRAGWPWRVLEGGHLLSWRTTASQRQATTNGLWTPGWIASVPNAPVHNKLPCRPLALGFALGALAYGACIYMLCAATWQIRRRYLASHHRCLACGYRLLSSPTCPECGEPRRR